MDNLKFNIKQFPSLLTDYDLVNGIAGVIWESVEQDEDSDISLNSVYDLSGKILGYIRYYDIAVKENE